MDEFIVKQLKNLKKVRPSASWLNSQRSFLLSEISKSEAPIEEPIQVFESARKTVFSFPIFNIAKILRPAFALAMFLVVLASSLGTVGAISAAQNSLPGDLLYTLKTAVENTQMTFAGTDESKVKLSIKFASERMDEFTEIASDPEKKKNVEKTVKGITEQLIVAQDGMDKLKDKNSEKVSEIAKLVNEQTSSYKETLIRTSEQLAYMMPEEREKIKTEIDQALIEVNKTQEKSDAIINPVLEEPEIETETEDSIIVPSEEEQTESKSIPFEEIIND
jgi:hypothetical protein